MHCICSEFYVLHTIPPSLHRHVYRNGQTTVESYQYPAVTVCFEVQRGAASCVLLALYI
eukprot:COSAG02_NODE_2281_length_9231_cov_15.017959_13_plen_59_part_00